MRHGLDTHGGSRDGCAVGATVGASVGAVGCIVGRSVGAEDGAVGAPVGCGVGAATTTLVHCAAFSEGFESAQHRTAYSGASTPSALSMHSPGGPEYLFNDQTKASIIRTTSCQLSLVGLLSTHYLQRSD